MNRDRMRNPPAIDPREHAIASHRWGEMACHLVHHQGRYYAWITLPDDSPDVVFAMPDEDAGRAFLAEWQASNLLHAGSWDDAFAHVFMLEPGNTSRIIYHAEVLDAAGAGFCLASRDTIGGEVSSAVACFGDLGAALEAFAENADEAADRIERGQTSDYRGLLAGVLRYRAAVVRAERARAMLGDEVRRNEDKIRGARSVMPVARAALGVSREFLYRVLAGDEWNWPRGRQVHPPGSRLPETPVRTLAAWTVAGEQFSLVSYRDTQGGACVAVDRDGEAGMPLCGVMVSDRDPVAAGVTMATMGRGTAAVYGGVHDSVTSVYAVMKDGERVDWPVCYDPENRQNYFAVIADCEELADIVAVTRTRQVSLKRHFAVWFRKAP